eukprot:6641016-Ditylum_brightwellii.AAC.1
MAAELLSSLFSGAMIPSDEDTSSSSSSYSPSELSPPRLHSASHRNGGKVRKYSRGSHRNDTDEESDTDHLDRSNRSRRQNRRPVNSKSPGERKKKNKMASIMKTRQRDTSISRDDVHVDDKISREIEYVVTEHTYCQNTDDFDEGMEVSVLTLPTVLQHMGDEEGNVISKVSRLSSPMRYSSNLTAQSPKSCKDSPHQKSTSSNEENIINDSYRRYQRPRDLMSSDYESSPVSSKEKNSEAIDEPPSLRTAQQYPLPHMDPQYKMGGD